MTLLMVTLTLDSEEPGAESQLGQSQGTGDDTFSLNFPIWEIGRSTLNSGCRATNAASALRGAALEELAGSSGAEGEGGREAGTAGPEIVAHLISQAFSAHGRLQSLVAVPARLVPEQRPFYPAFGEIKPPCRGATSGGSLAGCSLVTGAEARRRRCPQLPALPD